MIFGHKVHTALSHVLAKISSSGSGETPGGDIRFPDSIALRVSDLTYLRDHAEYPLLLKALNRTKHAESKSDF